jgi:hypothetical protein
MERSMGFLFIAAAVVTGAAPFQQYVLNSDVNVWDVASTDLNGDGNAEIFTICCDEKSEPLEKYVGVYMAGPDGAYPEKPTFRLNVDPTISTFFFAETDGTAPVELIAADAEGATVYKYQDGKFVVASKPRFSSLFPYKSKEPFFLKKGAIDLNGDGIDEWLIPKPSGYELRNASGPIATIECDVVSQMASTGSIYITHRLPAVYPFTRDGYSEKVVAFVSDEYADFALGPGWKEHDRFKIPVNVDEKWEASSSMDDIDGNGEPDLVITQTKGTINMKSLTHIYLARGPGKYPHAPDAEYQVSGALMSPLVVDVNGDKNKDVILVSIPLTAWNMVNFFVRGKVSVQAEVYLYGDGGFGKKPAFSESFLLDAPEGRESVAYTFGDFSGDGRLDVIFGAGANTLVVHTSSDDRLVSAKPWVTLSLPAFGSAHKMKLNANDSEDLVLSHPGGSNSKRVDVVVF